MGSTDGRPDYKCRHRSLGGHLKDHNLGGAARMFPGCRRKRRVHFDVTSYKGLDPGAVHYYVKLTEEDNPLWDAKERAWRSCWDDKKSQGSVVKSETKSASRSLEMVEELFRMHFSARTHRLVKGFVSSCV